MTPRPTKETTVSMTLGGVDHQVVEALRAVRLIAIRGFLALNAERRPRHRSQTLRADIFFAMQTHPEGAFVYAPQRATHVAQQLRFAIEIADRQLALGGMLHLVQSVRALFDGNAFTIAHEQLQFRLSCLQYFFEFF